MPSSLGTEGVAESPLTAGVDLPLSGRAAALARRTVTDVLRGWGVGAPEFTYDVLLLTSELVGNAVRHGGTRVVLELVLDASQLTVAVSDGSSVLPSQRDGHDEESGRGLTIVKAIADDWGVVHQRDGKTVWARLARPEDARVGQEAVAAGADPSGAAPPGDTLTGS